MRKRWRDKYSAREAHLDDSPTDMPVSLPGDELDAHEFDEDFSNPLLALGGSFEPLDASAGWELPEPSEQVEASFPPSAPLMPFLTAASDSHVKFVDKSLPSASSEPARFETVASMASPAVVSEALRLTDKRPVLYPWEKGRLGRIFGEQGRLQLKQPRLKQVSTTLSKLVLLFQMVFNWMHQSPCNMRERMQPYFNPWSRTSLDAHTWKSGRRRENMP